MLIHLFSFAIIYFVLVPAFDALSENHETFLRSTPATYASPELRMGNRRQWNNFWHSIFQCEENCDGTTAPPPRFSGSKLKAGPARKDYPPRLPPRKPLPSRGGLLGPVLPHQSTDAEQGGSALGEGQENREEENSFDHQAKSSHPAGNWRGQSEGRAFDAVTELSEEESVGQQSKPAGPDVNWLSIPSYKHANVISRGSSNRRSEPRTTSEKQALDEHKKPEESATNVDEQDEEEDPNSSDQYDGDDVESTGSHQEDRDSGKSNAEDYTEGPAYPLNPQLPFKFFKF